MSEHGNSPIVQQRADPILWVGFMLLFLFVWMLGSNIVEGLTGSDVSAEIIQPLPTAYATPIAALGAVTPTVISAEPTTTPTNTPSPQPTDSEESQPTHTVTPSPTGTATETPEPTNTATAVPTSTNTPRFIPSGAITDPVAAQATATPLPPTPTATTAWPTPIVKAGFSARVPILMYHYLSSPPYDADKYRVDLSVLPSEFDKQLRYLKENGYTTISLNDLSLALAGRGELPEKPIILTFDDGYRDNYENAFPILKAHGMKATFFIITDLQDIGHPAYMTWEMVEEMAAAGMHIEIHTKSHPNLEERSDAYMEEEVGVAQEIIAFHTGVVPYFLTYPGGTYDDKTVEQVEALGLWGALTTSHGYTHTFEDRYEMKRVRIRNTTDIGFFADWIEGKE